MSKYLQMKGLRHCIMIIFSLYTCPCCCVDTMCCFFRHLRAYVFDLSPLHATSSTLPKPPMPRVAITSRSLSCMSSYSGKGKGGGRGLSVKKRYLNYVTMENASTSQKEHVSSKISRAGFIPNAFSFNPILGFALGANNYTIYICRPLPSVDPNYFSYITFEKLEYYVKVLFPEL